MTFDDDYDCYNHRIIESSNDEYHDNLQPTATMKHGRGTPRPYNQ
jgi:hypothetical protein